MRKKIHRARFRARKQKTHDQRGFYCLKVVWAEDEPPPNYYDNQLIMYFEKFVVVELSFY